MSRTSNETQGNLLDEAYFAGIELWMGTFLKERPEFNQNGEDELPSVTWWRQNAQEGFKTDGVSKVFGLFLEETLGGEGSESDDLMSWLKALKKTYNVIDTGHEVLRLISTEAKANYLLDVLSFARGKMVGKNLDPSIHKAILGLAKRKYVNWVKNNKLDLDWVTLNQANETKVIRDSV